MINRTGASPALGPMHLWLVGNQGTSKHGNQIVGGASSVVRSAARPKGYSYVADLGGANQTASAIYAKLAAALVNLPSGIAVASSYNIPGIGPTSVKGPSGAAGTLDQAATSAGTTAQTAVNAAGLLTNGKFLFRALKFLGGLILAYLGLRQLASAGAGSNRIVKPSRPRVVPVPV